MDRRIERAIGIVVGIVVGIAVVVAFVFFGSRDTIDDPSINEGGGQTTIEVPVAPPEPVPGEPQRQP